MTTLTTFDLEWPGGPITLLINEAEIIQLWSDSESNYYLVGSGSQTAITGSVPKGVGIVRTEPFLSRDLLHAPP